ncbi:hypothetical protein AOLI_G00046450 [Acnodon oligacanthus]
MQLDFGKKLERTKGDNEAASRERSTSLLVHLVGQAQLQINPDTSQINSCNSALQLPFDSTWLHLSPLHLSSAPANQLHLKSAPATHLYNCLLIMNSTCFSFSLSQHCDFSLHSAPSKPTPSWISSWNPALQLPSDSTWLNLRSSPATQLCNSLQTLHASSSSCFNSFWFSSDVSQLSFISDQLCNYFLVQVVSMSD